MTAAARRPLLPSLLACAALLAGASCGGRTVTRDYSDFDRFRFEQRTGLGFCADLETVFGATIVSGSEDRLTFTPTSLGPHPDGGPDCSDGIPIGTSCMTPEPGPSRILSGEEAARVRAAFASLAIRPNPERRCRHVGIDPCLVLAFEWDGVAHTDYVCAEDRLPAARARALVDLLGDLEAAG